MKKTVKSLMQGLKAKKEPPSADEVDNVMVEALGAAFSATHLSDNYEEPDDDEVIVDTLTEVMNRGSSGNFFNVTNSGASNAAGSSGYPVLPSVNYPISQPTQEQGKKSKYRGVRQRYGRWGAQIALPDKSQQWLGTFNTEIEAAMEFDKAAFELRGKKAKLNFPNLVGNHNPVPQVEPTQGQDYAAYQGNIDDYFRSNNWSAGGSSSPNPPAIEDQGYDHLGSFAPPESHGFIGSGGESSSIYQEQEWEFADQEYEATDDVFNNTDPNSSFWD